MGNPLDRYLQKHGGNAEQAPLPISGGGSNPLDRYLNKHSGNSVVARTSATQQPDEPLGFIDYIKNLAKFQAAFDPGIGAGIGRMFGYSYDSADSEIIRASMAQRDDRGSAFDTVKSLGGAVGDILKFWDWGWLENWGTTKESIKSGVSGFKDQAKDPAQWGTLGGQMMLGMVKPLGDLIENMAGVDIGGGTLAPLSIEEKEERFKNAIGFAVSLGTVKLAGSAWKAGQVAEAAALASGEIGAAQLGKAAFRDVVTTSKHVRTGTFAKELVRKTAIGGAAGATYGATAFAGEEDQLAQIILNGIIFAPLGTAFELIGLPGEVKAINTNRQNARMLAALRSFQNVESNTLAGVLSQIKSLTTEADFVDALVKSKLRVNEAVIVDGSLLEGKDLGNGYDILPEPVVERPIPPAQREPWQQTREEFEQTGATVLHGTNRSFDRFVKSVRDRFGRAIDKGRFYFTDKPEVANTFAQSGAYDQVSVERFAELNNLDIDNLPEVFSELRSELQKALDKGQVITVADDDGNPVPIKTLEGLSDNDFFDNDIRVYRKGREPRVISTKVYGKTLDLTNPENIPADLRAALDAEGRYRPWMKSIPNFDHEHSQVLIDYARKNGYGKIKVKDVYESGFESIIGLEEYTGYGRDAHKEFVRAALAEGKPVPQAVLKAYPDLVPTVVKSKTTGRVLIAPRGFLYDTQKQMFQQFGYFKNQIVSFEGLTFRIDGMHRDGRAIITSVRTGQRQTVHASTLRETGIVQQFDPERLGDVVYEQFRDFLTSRFGEKMFTPEIISSAGFKDIPMGVDRLNKLPTPPPTPFRGPKTDTPPPLKLNMNDTGIPSNFQAMVEQAWQTVASRYPRLAAAVSQVEVLNKPESGMRGQWSTKNKTIRLNAANLADGEVGDVISVMLHELVHSAQTARRQFPVSTDPRHVGKITTSTDVQRIESFAYRMSRIADAIPAQDFNYATEFTKFATELGFDPREIPALRQEFGRRLRDELLDNSLPQSDKEFIKTTEAKATQLAAQLHMNDSRTLSKYLTKAGYIADTDGAGRVVIRDRNGNKLGTFDTFAEVQDFVQRAGQEIGYTLDGGGNIPPDAFAGDLMEPPDMTPDIDIAPNRRMTKFWDALHNYAPWATSMRDMFVTIDNTLGTEFFANVYDKTQNAVRVRNARMKGDLMELKKIEDLLIAAKIDRGRREIIGGYLETMSPDDVIRFGAVNRPMNQFEIDMAKRWSALGVDTKKVLAFRRVMEGLKKEVGADGWVDIWDINTDVGRRVDEIVGKMNLSTRDLKAYRDIVEDILTKKKDEASLGLIVRLRDALGTSGTGPDAALPGLSQTEYAAKHKLTPIELEVARRIQQMYLKLADTFNIPKEARLGGYQTHARIHYHGNMQAAFKDFTNDVDIKKFYAALTRTGEINAYERDPIMAMRRYIKAGFDDAHVSKAFSEAEEYIQQALVAKGVNNSQQLKPGILEKHVNIVRRYLEDARGVPDGDRAAMQETLDHVWKEFGFEKYVKAPKVRENIVNAISATGEGAAQGLRLVAAMRDLASGIIVSVGQYGIKHTAEVLENGARALFGGEAGELTKLGILPESGIVAFADPVEYYSSAVGKFSSFSKKANDINQLLFRLSGQKDIYTLLHAGHYITMNKKALQTIRSLRDGSVTVGDFKKELGLDAMDRPAAQHFADLVKQGRDAEAAQFLGIEAGREMVGVYGMANHPLGWNTNWGRIAGQFGQWSMWFHGTATRMGSRGTWGERASRVARFAAAQKAMTIAGSALGLNLTRWQPTTGIAFGGGPMVDAWMAVSDYTSGVGFMQEEGERKLLNLVPFFDMRRRGGSLDLDGYQPSIFMPGSFFINDVLEAATLASQGDYVKAVPRAFGVPVQQ